MTLFDKPGDEQRKAASTVPRNAREPGSPEWCYQTMNLMRDSYRHIHSDHLRFEQYLNELREYCAWEKVPVDHPYGSEEKMLVAELGRRVKEIEHELDAAKQDVSKARASVVNADAPDLMADGGDRRSDQSGTQKGVTRLKTPGELNDASYAHARLRRDRPDIHARVLAGEISAHAGMVEAGFRKKRQRKPRMRRCPKCGHEWR